MEDRNIPTTAAKLLVVIGPTASGKSALGLEIAKRMDGEIICADSRTVYKGLDVGTAKPSSEEQSQIPHHLLDVIEPDQNFTVADFKRLAEKAIDDIKTRGKLPIMVGGSGLYIDSVLYDYGFSDAEAPRDPANPRHLQKDVSKAKKPIREDAVIVGLNVSREVLKQRIANRVADMLNTGLLEEVMYLQLRYPNSKSLLAPGYKAFGEHIAGHLSLDEATNLFIKNDASLAKRQMTWFRRNQNIYWLNNPDTYIEQTMALLNKLH